MIDQFVSAQQGRGLRARAGSVRISQLIHSTDLTASYASYHGTHKVCLPSSRRPSGSVATRRQVLLKSRHGAGGAVRSLVVSTFRPISDALVGTCSASGELSRRCLLTAALFRCPHNLHRSRFTSGRPRVLRMPARGLARFLQNPFPVRKTDLHAQRRHHIVANPTMMKPPAASSCSMAQIAGGVAGVVRPAALATQPLPTDSSVRVRFARSGVRARLRRRRPGSGVRGRRRSNPPG